MSQLLYKCSPCVPCDVACVDHVLLYDASEKKISLTHGL